MRWEKVKLGDLANCIQPGPFGSQLHSSDYADEGIPIIMPKDMIGGKISHQDLIRVPDEHLQRLKRHQVFDGDLMVARKGDVRKCVYITENENGWLTGSDCLKVSLDKGKCYPKYIYYQLRSPFIGRWLETISIGATMPSLNTGLLSGIEISLPTIDEQMRIAEVLSSYDDLIVNNQKQIKLLEEAAQRLYKEWFVDLRFPGHETTPITDGIPEGWSIGEVAGFGEIVTGKTPSTSKEEYYGGNIPFVKIPDMHNRVFPVTTEVCLSKEGADTQKNKYIPRNSLMVSCIATVGLVNIALEECQTNQQINSVILHNERDLYFLYFTLKQMKDLLDGVGSNGATMTNVNKTKFGKIPVVCPSTDMRNAFYEWCEPVFRKIENLSRNIVLLQEARDSLLPKLMNGEIEV